MKRKKEKLFVQIVARNQMLRLNCVYRTTEVKSKTSLKELIGMVSSCLYAVKGVVNHLSKCSCYFLITCIGSLA